MADNIRDVIINGVSVHVRGVELFRNVDVKFIAGPGPGRGMGRRWGCPGSVPPPLWSMAGIPNQGLKLQCQGSQWGSVSVRSWTLRDQWETLRY